MVFLYYCFFQSISFHLYMYLLFCKTQFFKKKLSYHSHPTKQTYFLHFCYILSIILFNNTIIKILDSLVKLDIFTIFNHLNPL